MCFRSQARTFPVMMGPVLPFRPPPQRKKQCLKVLDFLFNDILMVLISISDIALDILVCRKFYLDGQMGFFYSSLAIFLFAQCCYSFLFAIHWGSKYSSPVKFLLFFLILPFGQLIPFLAWMDSFSNANTAIAEAATEELEAGGGDLLYDYIQKKFTSHYGFLVEALAEAIPQSILQTIAVLYFGEPSPLFIISIFVSICVISSKGYLMSYSMHRPTFVFNIICIFADVLCMFATICWLFDHEKDGDDDTTELFDVHDEIKATWMCLFCGAAVTMVTSSGCFVFFHTLNEHHEKDMGRVAYTSSTLLFLELYLSNFLGWFFSVVPMLVSLLSFKFMYFPFRSLQYREFAKYKTFYSALYEHLSTNKSDLKLHIANRFFMYCKGNQHRLQALLNPIPFPCQQREVLWQWLNTVVEDCTSNKLRDARFNEVSNNLFTSLNTSAPQEARITVRNFNGNASSPLTRQGFTSQLAKEFKLFDTFFNKAPEDNFPTIKRPLASLRYFLALLAAVFGFPLFAFFLLTTAVFLVYSWLYPLIELTRALVLTGCNFSAISTLPLSLSCAYIVAMLALICLTPAVQRFNNHMCTDIIPLSPMPAVFYNVMVVNRIKKMYDAEMTWHYLDRVFDSHFGMDVTLIIKSFLGAGALNMEGLYGSKSLMRMGVVVPVSAPAAPASPP